MVVYLILFYCLPLNVSYCCISKCILLFLLTEGEADWKMIAIAITDPWAAILNDVDDLESKLPGMLRIKYQNCTVLYTVLTYLVLCYTVL